jgi:HlyD family secretion protein
MRAIELARYGYRVGAACLLVAGLALGWRHLGSAGAPSLAATARASSEPPNEQVIHADGHIVLYPGAQVVVGTDVGGTLKAFALHEKDRVKTGEVIAEIEASEQTAALAEARARMSESEADITFFDRELDRAVRLLATDAVAQATVDRSEHERDAARARRAAAGASAWRLAAVVNKARIASPIDGVVTERFAEQGETVPAGARLLTVANLSRTRVEAEIDEYDAARVAVGQEVVIRIEGLAGRSWTGRVEEIPDEVVPRRLKPEDPGRPSDTRVLLVKIAPTEALPAKLGQRVEVELRRALPAG